MKRNPKAPYVLPSLGTESSDSESGAKLYTESDVESHISDGWYSQICRAKDCITMMPVHSWTWNSDTSIRTYYRCTKCQTPDMVMHWTVGYWEQ